MIIVLDDFTQRDMFIPIAAAGDTTMTAYLHRSTGKTWTLTLVARACNGAEFQNGEKITVAGKREAATICKARGATPHNF